MRKRKELNTDKNKSDNRQTNKNNDCKNYNEEKQDSNLTDNENIDSENLLNEIDDNENQDYSVDEQESNNNDVQLFDDQTNLECQENLGESSLDETSSNPVTSTSTDIALSILNKRSLNNYEKQVKSIVKKNLEWLEQLEKTTHSSKHEFIETLSKELIYQCMGKKTIINPALQPTYTFRPETARRTIELLAKLQGVLSVNVSGKQSEEGMKTDRVDYSVQIPNTPERTAEFLRVLRDSGVLKQGMNDDNSGSKPD